MRVKLLRLLGFLSASIVTALIIVSIAYRLFPSVNEKRLLRDNESLLDNYRLMDARLQKLQQQMGELEKRDNEVYRSIFEASPIPDSTRAKEMEQLKELQVVQQMNNNELTNSIVNSLNNLTARAAYQQKSYNELGGFIKNKEQLLASTPAIQPVSNKNLNRLASGFGYRVDPVYKTVKFHAGLDFAAPLGTPIYATADGIVRVAGNLGNGYGNHVVINHGYGYETLYGHMYRIGVKNGHKVKRGEVIGYVGSTGKSTGPASWYEATRTPAT